MNYYSIDLTKYDSSETFESLFKKANIKQYYYCKYKFCKITDKKLLKSYESRSYDYWKNLTIKNELQEDNVFLIVIPEMGN